MLKTEKFTDVCMTDVFNFDLFKFSAANLEKGLLPLFIYLFFFKFRYHSRVLYIDIDIHHGDGVQVTRSVPLILHFFHNLTLQIVISTLQYIVTACITGNLVN